MGSRKVEALTSRLSVRSSSKVSSFCLEKCSFKPDIRKSSTSSTTSKRKFKGVFDNLQADSFKRRLLKHYNVKLSLIELDL